MNKKELSIEELLAVSGGFAENVNSSFLLGPVLAYGIIIVPIIKKLFGK
ncbi:MAG: hypothetical protein GX175_06595 [Halanaerobiaceae bacterium]|nr:hypothetical protein [Halanaerobiaceae bacterium]